jgi:EAL domain-containing protein (putative c-di-GMP-specific phosphodiesterase class I)
VDREECLVCSIKSACDVDGMYVYAPTDILIQRLKGVLSEKDVPFSLHNQTFALKNRADRDRLLKTLQSELSGPEAEALRVTFDLVNLMGAKSLAQLAFRAETSWFEDALLNHRFVHWFQPIVDVRNGCIAGHECLIRLEKGDEGKFYGGQQIIDAAVARGDLHMFDSYSRRLAIRSAAQQHTGGKVFINFLPSSIYDPAFCMASTLEALKDTHLRPEDIVFEVVECEQVHDPRHLRKIVSFYREKGFAVALDDVGSGSNSIQMMSEIRPDFIKLDKSIVWNFSTQIGLKSIRKLAELGAETNIAVIAEGVETEAMRDAMLDCGISLMQGYYFGKPAPVMS